MILYGTTYIKWSYHFFLMKENGSKDTLHSIIKEPRESSLVTTCCHRSNVYKCKYNHILAIMTMTLSRPCT